MNDPQTVTTTSLPKAFSEQTAIKKSNIESTF
jgi:hypothetical protein